MQVTRIVQKDVKEAIPEDDSEDSEGYKNNRRTGERSIPVSKRFLKRYLAPEIR